MQVWGMLSGDFANPDRRQGNEDLNNVFRYIDMYLVIQNRIGIRTPNKEVESL